jgi:hypothetical protein
LGHHGWSMAVHSPPWEQQCWLYPPYGPLLPSSPSHISCHSHTPQFLISTRRVTDFTKPVISLSPAHCSLSFVGSQW